MAASHPTETAVVARSPLRSFDVESLEIANRSMPVDINAEEEGPPSCAARCSALLFPCQPFSICPSALSMWIPGTWRKIQDFTHLVLIFGSFAATILIIKAIILIVVAVFALTRASESGCGPLCVIQQIVTVVGMVPNVMYYSSIVSRYDEQLQIKQKEIAAQKEKLLDSYNSLVSDMEHLLQKAAQSSAGLAERSFESKRRDFQRFLERVRSRYSEFFGASKADADAFLIQFKAFVMNWVKIFKECSLDPLHHPIEVITEEELANCTTVGEVVDLTTERLKAKQVQFITSKREQDVKDIRATSVNVRRLTRNPARAARQVSRRCTWCQVGNMGCACRSNDGEYPRFCSCGCMRCVLLSKNHVVLIGFCLFTVLLIGFEALAASIDLQLRTKHDPKAADNGMWVVPVVLFSVNLFCAVVVLLQFEQLDIIEQLQVELRSLQVMKDTVEEKNEEMQAFYGAVQELTDVWLHRTIPRLDLLKELHSHLEDAREGHITQDLAKTNKAIAVIELQVGPLSKWTDDALLPEAKKKRIGQEINQCGRATQFDHVLEELNKLTRSGTLAITM